MTKIVTLASGETAPVRAAAPPPLVALRGVDKVFANRVCALEGLDLDINRGEFLSLLGPSGCGKSTVLRLLAGLVTPTRGVISWSCERPELGFVFQEPTLTPWSDVFANVWLPLRLGGVAMEKARPRVEEALEQVGLGGFAKAYPRQLSGGMKMRVSIARALVTRPAVLLMDEPFAALDEITRLKLNDDLAALRSSLGATVVFVTHSVFESVYLSDRIVVMAARPGRAVAEIVVEAPSATRSEGFRLTAEYAETCRRTSRALHVAMGEEPPTMLEGHGP
jgi:NitT/TauT family transport system ATP-binding protein